MRFIADIHLHSRWSRATSRDLDPENLCKWSANKGIGVIGTADFTHPEWLAELKQKLVPAEPGLYQLRPELVDAVEEQVPPSCRREVRFLLTVEISSIYKRHGATRKVHNVVCLPDFDAVDGLNRRLGAIGNLKSDGRPILGLDSRDLLAICLEVCPEVLFIPAHIWTPHFAVLGASSGFDSLEECYDDLLPHIFAVETGLSSDPPMNSRLSALDRFAVVSNSDAHSPSKLGREATCFDTELSYAGIYEALRTRDRRLRGTIEFYPEEGKYHYDGHRKCQVRWKPAQTLAAGGRCPECDRKLTVGVLHRVEALADRAEDEAPTVERPFEYLIALDEVIGSCVGVGPKSKKVRGIYQHLLEQLGPELSILRHLDPEAIAECGLPLVAEGVRRMRDGRVAIAPGYDGEYGVIEVFTDEERRQLAGQGKLFDLAPAPAAGPSEIAAAAVVERIATGAPPAAERVEALHAAADQVVATVPVTTAGLDDAQHAAVRAARGPVAVIAGPGSGKTRTLTRRIAWLVGEQAVDPGRIAAVTFTQRAAREMRQRLDALFGEAAAQIHVGTFHRLALDLWAELTGEPAPLVVDEIEARGLLRDARQGLEGGGRLRDVQARISRWKADGLRPAAVGDDPLAPVYAAYEARRLACGVSDYDDLLLDLLERLRADAALRAAAAARYAHLLVDEFQDVNLVQYELVRILAGAGEGLFVIGDPDQAIYAFRGADPRYFERLRVDFADTAVHRLLRNYRSVPDIVSAADAVLGRNDERAVDGPSPAADAPPALHVLEAPGELAEGIGVAHAVAALVGGADMVAADRDSAALDETYSFGDIAVLFRTGRQATVLEECLCTEGLPYRVVGPKRFLEERGARDAVAFFRYALDPSRPLRLLEALRTGPFDIGAAALGRLGTALGSATELEAAVVGLPTPAAAQVEALRRAAAGYARRSQAEAPATVLRVWQRDLGVEATDAFKRLLQVAETAGSMDALLDTLLLGREADIERRAVHGASTEAVTLMTMHAAKGLEFPVVFVCGMEDGLVPLRDGDGRVDDLEEERRLFYVALTRARERVILTRARQRRVRGARHGQAPSPFLDAIPAHICTREAVSTGSRRRGTQLSLF